MNRSPLRGIQSSPEVVINRVRSNSMDNDDEDDNIFTKTESHDDQQAQMRRRVPTRHSIKSHSNRKTSSRQTSTSEVRMNQCFFPFLFVSMSFVLWHVS